MPGESGDEQRIQRWLDVLRDGDEFDKIAARRGLARVFEQRGMFAEAIELLERNIAAGASGADTHRWLSRLYRAQVNEAESLEAAVTASQDQVVPPVFEPAAAREEQTRPARGQTIRRRLLLLLMLLGLGIVAGILWMAMIDHWFR